MVSVLVLTRKAGQRIQIGPDIFVTVVNLHSGAVRLGIEAPPELAIVRSEIAEQMEKNQSAAKRGDSLRIFQGDAADS